MENKDSYTSEEMAQAIAIYYCIAHEMNNLQQTMLETREIHSKKMSKSDFGAAWGHVLGNRYVGAQQALERVYQEAVPENIREALRSQGMSLDKYLEISSPREGEGRSEEGSK